MRLRLIEGRLSVRELRLGLSGQCAGASVRVAADGREVAAAAGCQGREVSVVLGGELLLAAGSTLEVIVGPQPGEAPRAPSAGA